MIEEAIKNDTEVDQENITRYRKSTLFSFYTSRPKEFFFDREEITNKQNNEGAHNNDKHSTTVNGNSP